jgi:hypothetical protein
MGVHLAGLGLRGTSPDQSNVSINEPCMQHQADGPRGMNDKPTTGHLEYRCVVTWCASAIDHHLAGLGLRGTSPDQSKASISLSWRRDATSGRSRHRAMKRSRFLPRQSCT